MTPVEQPAERVETFTIDKRWGRVVVVSTREGWTLHGEATHRKPETRDEFTASILRCPCDPEHVGAAEYKGVRREPCTCKRANHLGGRFCHGWHVDRVRELAEAVVRTYGR